MWLYDSADLYRLSERARQVLNELSQFSERTESGKHFTEAFRYWTVLEDCGWIAVRRPVHPATGIQYSCEYWDAELTEHGKGVVEYLQQLLEDGQLE
jgi:hypothetical protein